MILTRWFCAPFIIVMNTIALCIFPGIIMPFGAVFEFIQDTAKGERRDYKEYLITAFIPLIAPWVMAYRFIKTGTTDED
jgi:hypothetical protein